MIQTYHISKPEKNTDMNHAQDSVIKQLETLFLRLVRCLENVGNTYKAGVKEARLSKHLTPVRMNSIYLFINALQINTCGDNGQTSLGASEILTLFIFKSGDHLKEGFQKSSLKTFTISILQLQLCLEQLPET